MYQCIKPQVLRVQKPVLTTNSLYFWINNISPINCTVALHH